MTAVAIVLAMWGGLFGASLLDERHVAAPGSDVRTRSAAFAYMETQVGSFDPVTYDPCVPIHLVVDPRKIVDKGMRLLEEALDEVRDATGLTFVVDGLTKEPAPEQGGMTTADGGPLPVRVSWSDPDAAKELKGSVTGQAGSTWIERDGWRWYITGRILLDGPQLANLLKRPDGWQMARAVVMHELGHLVGLDHVDIGGQLMQPKTSRSLTRWGDGDWTGLNALGAGKCVEN